MDIYMLIMEILTFFLVKFYQVYIYIFLAIIVLGFWYLKSNKILKIKIGSFNKEIKRKKFLIFFTMPIFTIPMILILLALSFNTENTRLNLSEEYILDDNIIYGKYILFGPYYGNGVSHYGIITKIQKIDEDIWIGYIRDESKEKYPYYDNPVYPIISEDEDKGEDNIWKEKLIEKLEKTKGYFIIEKDKAVFGLSKVEVERRINKKVNFFFSTMYYLEKYGYKY